MTSVIARGFADLLARLQPAPREARVRQSHETVIAQAARAAFRGFNRVEVFGSHRRNTAIRSFSDVDYLAVLSKADVLWDGKPRNSKTVLTRLRHSLALRLQPYGTAVRIRGSAVVIGFQEGAVDVVPAFWAGTTRLDGYPAFKIPDGVGGWLVTSPQRHAKYVAESDAASGFKLSKTAQLLKAWKYSRRTVVPILGFHMELLLAESGVCAGAKSYAACLEDAFALLESRSGRAIQDPLGLSGLIASSSRSEQADSIAIHARKALRCARLALSHESCSQNAKAAQQWNSVFNGHFSIQGLRRV